jgi:hypothetical protein
MKNTHSVCSGIQYPSPEIISLEEYMSIHKKTIAFAIVFVLLLFTAACQIGGESDSDTEIAVAVALTQTAAAQAQPPIEEPTVASAENPLDLQPLNPEDCNNLANAMGQNLGIQGQLSEVPFEDPITQKSGMGCKIIFTTTGQEIDNIGVLSVPAEVTMENLGWQEDGQYAAAGAGGVAYGYRKANGLCRLVMAAAPSDMALCSDDEPISMCWERLSPEQKMFTVELNCVQGDLPEFVPQIQPVEAALNRIEFGVGETSTDVNGVLAPGGIDHYVLGAGAGQDFIMNFYPPGVATIVIYGADGEVLKSDLNNVNDWSGMIPISQDYFIDITSVVDIETEYTLSISIPPLTPIATTGKISGSITYPDENIPTLHIVAYNVESNLWYYQLTFENSSFYEITGLPPGTYNLVAYSQENLASGHLTPIIVNAGETTENINLTEWLDAGSAPFPPDPVGW